MRIAVDIGAPAGGDWRAWRDLAVTADREGLDGVLVGATAGANGPDSLILAASLAEPTRDLQILARVGVGLHPVHLAERIAVADQALAGRLVVVLDVGSDQELAEETLTVLDLALADRPFRHEGRRWRIPAGLHASDPGSFRMTPAPAVLEVPVWVAGPEARAVAIASGRAWLAPSEEREPVWPTSRPGSVRPALRAAGPGSSGALPVSATATSLRSDADRHGLTYAVLITSPTTSTGPPSLGQVTRIARGIRPRVQLAQLDPGLEEFWDGSALDEARPGPTQ